MIRILVAEDDTAMNKLICSMLAEKGMNRSPASTARRRSAPMKTSRSTW